MKKPEKLRLKRWTSKRKGFSFISLFGFILIAFAVASCSSGNLAHQTTPDRSKQRKYDLIIIPGAPFNGKEWSWLMQTRIHWAKVLYDKGITDKILFSGGAVYTPYCEAVIMSMYARAIGIPPEAILLETKAEHGVENVFNSYIIARSLGYDRIAVATDLFQTLYLKKITKRLISAEIRFLPIQYTEIDKILINCKDVSISHSKAYRENFMSIVEKESFSTRMWKSRGGKLLKMSQDIARSNETNRDPNNKKQKP